MFFSVHEGPSVDCSSAISVCSLSLLLSRSPLALVDVLIWIGHCSLSVFQIVFPISLVDVAIGVSVGAPPLFAFSDSPREAFPVPKEVVALQ